MSETSCYDHGYYYDAVNKVCPWCELEKAHREVEMADTAAEKLRLERDALRHRLSDLLEYVGQLEVMHYSPHKQLAKHPYVLAAKLELGINI